MIALGSDQAGYELKQEIIKYSHRIFGINNSTDSLQMR